MVASTDSRKRLALVATLIFVGGWALLYFGLPMALGGSLPAVVAAIPPGIFACLILVLLLGNARQVRSARDLLAHGESSNPTDLHWELFAVAGVGREGDLRAWCLPVRHGSSERVLVAIEQLDQHQDWNPRQSRTVLLTVTFDNETVRVTSIVPSAVSTAALKSGAVFRKPGNIGHAYGFCIPPLGFYPAILASLD